MALLEEMFWLLCMDYKEVYLVSGFIREYPTMGILDILLDSVFVTNPEITPEMLRVEGKGDAALEGQQEPSGGPITATLNPKASFSVVARGCHSERSRGILKRPESKDSSTALGMTGALLVIVEIAQRL